MVFLKTLSEPLGSRVTVIFLVGMPSRPTEDSLGIILSVIRKRNEAILENDALTAL